MTLGEALQQARARDLPLAHAQQLLEAASGCNRARQLAFPETPLNAAQQQAWEQLLARHEDGEPLAYLTGVQGFMDLTLQVGPDVLIPRPDTELLVEAALQLDLPTSCRIADLGTGSGAVALSLARARPRWQVLAIDLSARALAVARTNLDQAHPGRVQLLHCSWLQALATASLDLIVSNPPYVASSDPDLAPEVARHEPHAALFAGADGLTAIRAIVADATRVLRAGGWLLLEHGARQGKAVRQLLTSTGLAAVRTLADAGGHERVTLGFMPLLAE